jgi:hypothetical protein
VPAAFSRDTGFLASMRLHGWGSASPSTDTFIRAGSQGMAWGGGAIAGVPGWWFSLFWACKARCAVLVMLEKLELARVSLSMWGKPSLRPSPMSMLRSIFSGLVCCAINLKNSIVRWKSSWSSSRLMNCERTWCL